MITKEEHELIQQVLDAVDVAADCAIGNDEVAKVRAIIERETIQDKCGIEGCTMEWGHEGSLHMVGLGRMHSAPKEAHFHATRQLLKRHLDKR